MNVQKAVHQTQGDFDYLLSEEEVKNSLNIARKVIGHLVNELPFWKRLWFGVKALLGLLDDYLYDTGGDE